MSFDSAQHDVTLSGVEGLKQKSPGEKFVY